MSRFFSLLVDRMRRVVRVSAYFAVVTLVLGTIAARRVYGSVEKSALEIGSGLAQLGDVVGPAYRVSINGEVMNVSSAMTDDSLDEVLDRFEKECREHAGGLEEELAALRQTLQSRAPSAMKGPAGVGVVRTREERRGMVACLARGDDRGYRGELEALSRFAISGDLADLGKLRYVLAERMPSGRTHVLAAWTEGSFRVGRLFPASGDCPGSDVPGAYRPDGSRRLLTASVEGAPFGVRIYQAAGTPDEVLASYGRGMLAAGWSAAPAVDGELRHGRAFLRGAVDLLVSAQPSRDRTSTVVSVVEMPPR